VILLVTNDRPGKRLPVFRSR